MMSAFRVTRVTRKVAPVSAMRCGAARRTTLIQLAHIETREAQRATLLMHKHAFSSFVEADHRNTELNY
jgi:hypothetical protein